MTAPSPAPALHRPRDLDGILALLQQKYFGEHPLSRTPEGAVVAQYFRSRLTSAFQPIVRAADGSVTGHHGLLRVQGETGAPAAPWSVFAQASNDGQLVGLDRLARTVHALNYFPGARADASLFLNVEQRLLTGVSADHGAYYEAILALLGIAPNRVVIVMPPGAADDPAVFVRAAISYRIRGYRVLAQVRSTAESDLAHVFLAEPHFIALDASPATLKAGARFVDAFKRRGIHGLARRIETPEQAGAAREAGYDLLAGQLFGAPASAPP
jgi:EAL domain-containing protein (putative c-di-GMP-specific phosphodiesterase class I)